MLRPLGERVRRDAVGLEIDYDQRTVLLKEAVHHALQKDLVSGARLRHKARGALKQREAVFPPGPLPCRADARTVGFCRNRVSAAASTARACSGVSRRRSSMLLTAARTAPSSAGVEKSRNCSAACIAVPLLGGRKRRRPLQKSRLREAPQARRQRGVLRDLLVKRTSLELRRGQLRR